MERFAFISALIGLSVFLTLPVEEAAYAQREKVGQNGAVRSERASYYGGKDGFHGRPTASQQKFNQNAHTAAHKELPLGTKIKVTDPNTEKSVEVVVNDRMPSKSRRSLDLSKGAAEKIGLTQRGVASVNVEVLEQAKE